MAALFLGVNIDHIATLRNVRGGTSPDPIQAAFIAEQAGADGITVHLREDRRHITERDLHLLRQTVQTRLNLELAPTEELLAIAIALKPQHCCLVPERREERTTECGLNVINQLSTLREATTRLTAEGIQVAIFVDPDCRQVDGARDVGASAVEIHTGAYAGAQSASHRAAALQKIATVVEYAAQQKLQVHAGHGLNYHNVQPIAALSVLQELNIGHAIIAHAVMHGLATAVTEMKQLMLAMR